MRVALIVGILALAGLPALSGVAAQTPSTSPKVGLSRGTLIAVGGGMPADVMARFIALAGGPDAPIVAIPPSGTCILADGSQQVSDGCTAAGLVAGRPNTNNRPRQSAVKETEALMRSFGARNVTVIETYDRTVADTAAFVAPLARASGFWAPGGVPSTLMQAFGGTRTEQELRKLLERGGVIGGTSAGAMIRHRPSVLMFNGVFASIFSRSRIGLSISSARLFPCFVNVFTISAPLTMLSHCIIGKRPGQLKRASVSQLDRNVTSVNSLEMSRCSCGVLLGSEA